MAKNDSSNQAAQSQFNTAVPALTNTAQTNLNKIGGTLDTQGQNLTDRFNQSADTQTTGSGPGSYMGIMNNWQDYYNNPLGGGQNPYAMNFGSTGGGGGGVSGAGGVNLDPFGNEYGGYQGFANGAGQVNWNTVDVNQFNDEYAKYKQFSETGGFSPQDIQDIRARAIAPT